MRGEKAIWVQKSKILYRDVGSKIEKSVWRMGVGRVCCPKIENLCEGF
jgi:hypothetical protein